MTDKKRVDFLEAQADVDQGVYMILVPIAGDLRESIDVLFDVLEEGK